MQGRINYSNRIGNKAEIDFTKICERKKYIVHQATKQEDIYEHWDKKVILPNGKSYKVDVKAIKDNKLDSTFLELIGNTGKNGWLLGLADFIAFQQKEGFVYFKRIDLLKWFYKKVGVGSIDEVRDLYSKLYDKQGNRLNVKVSNSNMFVSDKKDALYKMYSRKPWGDKARHDVITLVFISDMKKDLKHWLLK